MRKTLYALLTSALFSILFLGGASLAFAQAAPTIGFWCDPYTASFVTGQAYIPANDSLCSFTLDPLDTGSFRLMGIYEGTVGSSTPVGAEWFAFPGDPGPQYAQNGNPFQNYNPQPGDAFFSAADTSFGDQTYLTTGAGSPPDNLQVLAWHWGAPAVVTADDRTIGEGAPIPALTATVSGFVGSDSASSNDITGAADCITTAPDSSMVGDFPITCTRGTLSSSKYAFDSFVGGTLHIIQPELTVTAADATMTYGGVIQTLGAILGGFINGETLETSDVTGLPDCTTTATSASPAGTYPITCSIGTLSSSNYSFGSFFPGLFTVLPAPLTVTADDKSMVSGGAVPTLTATPSGFVNGETLATSGVTGGASCSTSATSASPASNYPITCMAGSLAAHNYAFTTFVDGTLTVTAPIGPTVTITNPIANQAYEKSDSVILGVTVVDTVRIVATTTLFNGTPFDPTQPIPFYTASPGTSTVKVTVRDANGLSATASVSFLITRPGGDQCYTEAEGWWNRGWVWTSDDFYHVLIDCSDLDNFHRDRHDLENSHNHDSNWHKKDKDVSDGVKNRNDDMDKRVHKNGH